MAKPINRKASLKSLKLAIKKASDAEVKAALRLDKIDEMIFSTKEQIIKGLRQIEFGRKFTDKTVNRIMGFVCRFAGLSTDWKRADDEAAKAYKVLDKAGQAYEKELNKNRKSMIGGKKRGGR